MCNGPSIPPERRALPCRATPSMQSGMQSSNTPNLLSLREAARQRMQAREWHPALELIARALEDVPHDPRWLISRAQCLLALGRRREACEAAAAARRGAPMDAIMLDAIGSLFSQADDQVRALEAFDLAVAIAPTHPHFIFNRATVKRFLGRLAEAEQDYDRVIALKPHDYEAFKNRSELRTQTQFTNHIPELEQVLAHGIDDRQGAVQIRYALAKEYEDLGEYAKSFAHLTAGNQERRRHMRYEVGGDEATADWIIQAFPGAVPLDPSATEADPIFIVGLPRSGTTLVDRVLGSHSGIHSAGELDYFAQCLVAAVRRDHPTPLPRQELVARSAGLDFTALGHAYLECTRLGVATSLRISDKMPLNYLYCGLIHRALPNAKIVHMTRHPMAAGYAMYKTLFKDAYPFSYDLEEIGRYYVAYRRLMDHWQTSLPGVIHEVSYEALVTDQHRETAKLLEFCGLDWQEACVDFHRNVAATTTASAVQVRQPMYRTSLSQWRHYEKELQPLATILRAAGLETE